MRILITGGSGFIGTNLISYLICKGHLITNIDITPPLNKEHSSLWKQVDIMQPRAVLNAFKDFEPDWVIHLAGRADCDENTTVEEGYSANTKGHQNVLDAIKSTPCVNKAVITSSQYVCGPGHCPKDEHDYAPVTVYGQSKVITETLTREANLKCTWTIIRPTNIWGPWHRRYEREFWKIAHKGLYFHPGGEPVTRCYGYVGNLVVHIEKILESDPEVVNKKVFYLSDPAGDIYKWANSFCVALNGKNAPKIPRFVLRMMGAIGDVISTITKKPFYVTSSRVNSMTSDYLVPGWIENTIEILGPPANTLDEGVRKTADWFLKNQIASNRKKRIIVAGQLPPPVGGQNIMIQHTLDTLRGSSVWKVDHLPLNFNTSFAKIRSFSFGKILELLKIIVRLCRLRIAGRIDLLIYPFGGKHKMPMIRDILLLPFCFLVSRKVVVWFHTGGISDELKSLPALFRNIYLFVFRRVNAAIVMTDFNKCDPIALGIQEIHVIPHQIPDRADQKNDSPTKISVRLLYIGHIYPDKGIPELLEAFDLVADHEEDIELDLVGEVISPWNAEILLKSISTMRHGNRVKWHGLAQGEIKDQFFRDASVLIFPSIAPGESFGLVLAEGLMWGLPIIATDWRGAKDVLTPNFYGRLVDCEPSLSSNLAKSINSLLSEKNEWLRKRKVNRDIYLNNYCEHSGSQILNETIPTLLS